MARKPIGKTEVIELPPIDIGHLSIKLVGDSPLIVHRWSEKAKKQILDKQMKKATKKKEAKDPKADYKNSLYEHPDGGYGFPAVGFKASAVNACSHLSGVTKVAARGAFHIDEELVKIKGRPTMREDMVRIGMGVADIRYRGEFKKWSVEIVLRYNKDVISPEQIVNLFNTAGFAIGVGEWRPQKNGSYGMFHVV